MRWPPGLTPKRYIAGLLILLAIIGGFHHGYGDIMSQLAIAVLVAVVIDIIFYYIKTKKVILPSSAFITGMIIAMVLSPQSEWYIIGVASIIAIAQKHIIRYKHRHIFNPANFGLLAVIFLFSASTSWWGQSSLPLLILGGGFLCYRMRRLKLPVIFTCVLLAILLLNNLFLDKPPGYALFLVNFFFIFIMLTEHKTSPTTKKGLVAYAVLVAVFVFIFFRLLPQYDFSILGLACGNMFVPLLNKIK